MMRIAVACGGTGGHIFPGLATARALEKRGHDVTLWITGRDAENKALKGWNGGIALVGGRGIGRLPVAFARSVARMLIRRPNVLLAMGSYASVAPALAARMLGVPVVLHEANAVPGRAISALSRFAEVIAVAFEAAAGHFRHPRIITTGFPVRADLLADCGERASNSGEFTVLVAGGSQGAHRLNEVASAALNMLYESGVPARVIHLTGRADETTVRQAYRRSGIPHEVFDFAEHIGKLYNSADLAVTRAGAATCAELSLCGVPALLVPLPSAVRNHQMENARVLERAGAVDVMAEAELTIERLAGYIGKARLAPERLDGMRRALKTIAVPDAADRLADLIEQVGDEVMVHG